jgi:PhzF family phenazine biosynthesis protein
MKQYTVDAFTDKVFSGNPAAVCIMDKWPEDFWMKQVAAENNLSETAFVVKEKEGYRLRWFTPAVEVELCGHATLAAAFVLFSFYEKGAERIDFQTRSGKVSVSRKNDLYVLDFPTCELKEIPVTDAMQEAFGVRPVKAVLGMDLICVFEEEDIIRNLRPDQTLLAKLDGRIQNATAKGKDFDCISRSFCPKLSIVEDPVCGSAHCQIADYWSKELDKNEITACQASKRGGTLYCKILENGRMEIGGKAVLFAESKIQGPEE